MSLILFFEVPGGPYPAARAGRVTIRTEKKTFTRSFTTSKTDSYEKRVGIFTIRAMAAARWPRDANAPDKGRGPYGLRLDFFRDVDVGDVDNFAKAAMDGMSKARIWANDKFVHEAHIRLFIDRVRPRTEISVWRLEQFATMRNNLIMKGGL